MNTTTWPEGIKKTKQREAIWSVLTSTDKPITAIEIAERLGNGSTTWMSTIYRTLELLNKGNRYSYNTDGQRYGIL